MAVAVTFQLVTPVFADTEGTEETTAPTEAVVETKAPTEAPAEETTAPTEETTAPTEETSAPTEATEETEEATEVTEETVEDIALFAEDGDVIASGECGRYSSDDLTWVLTGDGTLTISGSGEMAYYSMDNSRRTTAPWVAYWEQITAIVLEPGVTSVGGTAFSACSNVLSVSIPSTVTYIDSSAFEECENMTNITFGHKFDDSLRIDESSFDSAYRLARTIRVPSARRINKAIETYRWDRSCRSINYVSTENIPMEGITIENSESTASVELGTQVELQVSLNPIDTTDDYTWTVVSEKTTADARISKDGVLTTLSTGTVTVRVQCAQNPAVFDEIVVTILPPTGALTSLAVTTLNDYPGDAELGKPVQMIPVFTPANAAERSVSWSLENGTGTATIDNNGLLTPLTTGTVMVYATTPSGIEGGCTVNIVRYAEEITILLNGKEGLSRFAAGEGAELSFRLFPEDTTTKEVEWEVTNGTGAAKLCIDSDHEYAKLECQKAGSVMLTATAKDSKQVVATKELTITDTVCTYALPDGSGNLYYNAETGWITGADETVKNVLIPAKIDGVTIVGIDPYVFANRSDYWGYVNDNTTLTSVSIPNTMEEIGENAFKQCTALSTLRFAPGSKLKTIGEYAFQGCSSITSLTIPDGLKNIGDGAFCGLKNLKYLTMSGEVDGSGWIDWWSIDTLTLTGTYVMGRAPADKDGYIWYDTLPGRNARKVILSEGITSIDDYAFNRCQNLEQLVLPTSLQTIGAHAFEFCENLTDITIPDSLQTLGQDCFKECNKLQLIDMSKVPDTFIERETYLTGMVTFPDWLVRATKGKAEIGWDLYQTDTGYETIGRNAHMSIRIGATGGSLRRINPASATLSAKTPTPASAAARKSKSKPALLFVPPIPATWSAAVNWRFPRGTCRRKAGLTWIGVWLPAVRNMRPLMTGATLPQRRYMPLNRSPSLPSHMMTASG